MSNFFFVSYNEVFNKVRAILLQSFQDEIYNYLNGNQECIDQEFLKGIRNTLRNFHATCIHFKELPDCADSLFRENPNYKYIVILKSENTTGESYIISRDCIPKENNSKK